MSRDDAERRWFEKATGKLKHYCHDWDGMAIDETCPEIECCTCDFSDVFTESEVREIVTEASKSWPKPPETYTETGEVWDG